MKHSSKRILFLSLENVIQCGGTDILLAAADVAQGFLLLTDKKVINPVKTSLRGKKGLHEHSIGLVNFLPSYIELPKGDVIGCKILGAMPSNVELGLPRATGIIVLFDFNTKTPICVMDAQAISATRTGGVTYLAAQKLANPDTDEGGLVGAGDNMRTQLLGLKLALHHLKKVRVFSRGESKHVFAREMGERTGLDITAVESAREAVEDCRLMVTCLPNINKPVVKARWVREKGVTVINIGCYENETVLLTRMDRIVADIWEHGKHRGVQTHAIAVADGVIPESRIEDFAPILAEKRPGRLTPEENIFFCPTGLGFEDTLVAWRVYNMAKEKGVGTWLTLWESPKWI